MGDMILGNATAYADAVRGGYTGTREEWEAEMANLGSTRTIAEEKAQEAKTAAQQATAATAVIDGVVDEVTALKEETQALHDEVMQQESSNKQDKDLNAIAGDVAVFDNEGNTVDSDIHTDDVVVHPGVYDDLNVGSAKNLEDIYATPVPAEFGHRTTAGKVSISEHGVATFDTIRGRTEIPNQLVSPTNLNKVSGNGVLEVTDAAGGPAKSLELRGASLVKNQLVANGDFGIGVAGWTVSGGYVSITDSVTFTYLDDASTRNILTSCAVVSGHVYIVGCTFKDAGLENGAYVLRIIDGASVDILADTQKTWKTYSSVFTATGSSVRLSLANYNGTISDVTTVQFRNVQLVDLTLLFNGNTTKINAVHTWEDLVAIMPEYGQYVVYNPGEVVGSDASWKVIGRNLFNSSIFTSHGGVLQEDGSYYFLGPGSMNAVHIYDDDGYAGRLALTYSVKYKTTGTALGIFFYVHYTDGSLGVPSVGTSTGQWQTVTFVTAANKQVAYIEGKYNTGGNSTWIKNLQIERGAVVTTYIPYSEISIAPTAPLFSAGTVYDREDVISGKRTQRIGSYTFTGNEVWTKPTPTAHPDAFGCDISGRANGNGNLLLAGYVNITDITTFYATDKSTRGDTSSSRITIRDSAYTDIAAFAAYMAGKTIYYELATPVVTDITPTPVALQAGTNTFTQISGVIRQTTLGLNYDGTRWNIPVSSASKYIVRTDSEDAYVTGVTSIAVDAAHHKVIDLTRWFGRGYEPTTLADFYALYPLWQGADIPYMPGSVVNFKGTAVVSRFFNAYSHETGTADLLGGNQYQICGTYTTVSYETIRGAAETLDIDANGIFTPVENGVLTVVGGNDTDTCVHLTWSGYKNYGTDGYRFDKYGESVRELPVTEYFPNGMNGLWGKYDELTEDKRVMRYDSIAFNGSENWRIYSNSNYRGFALDPATRKYRMLRPACASMFGIQTKGQSATSGSMCFWFTDSGTGSIAFFSILKTDAASVAYMQYMGFYDAATDTCDLEAFKAWLTKYPVTVVFDISDTTVNTNGVDYTESQSIEPPLNLSYTADDFGTEELLPRNTLDNITTTRMDALIRYNLDFTRLGVHVSEIWNYLEDLAKNNADYARAFGYYKQMTVGLAENLIDIHAMGEDRTFQLDTSCGEKSISDDGSAGVQVMKGSTVMWNQKFVERIPSTNVYTCQKYGDVTLIQGLGSSIYVCAWRDIYGNTNQGHAAYNKHVYLGVYDIFKHDGNYAPASVLNGGQYSSTVFSYLGTDQPAGKWIRCYSCQVSNKDSTNALGFSIFYGAFTVPRSRYSLRNQAVYDLTLMFGFGREPKTYEEFLRRFPDPAYPPESSRTVNFNGESIATVGFNQCDPDATHIRVFPQAYQITGPGTLNFYDTELSSAPVAVAYGSTVEPFGFYKNGTKWYRALLGIADYDATKTYHVNDGVVYESQWYKCNTRIATAEEFDASKWDAVTLDDALADNFLFTPLFIEPDADGIFTPPTRGWLYYDGVTAETCIHFTWSGYRNGEHEDYWREERELPVKRYFPDGMLGAESTATEGLWVRDELWPDKAVKRIGVYTFTGNETYATTVSGSYRYWTVTLPLSSLIIPDKATTFCSRIDGLVTWTNSGGFSTLVSTTSGSNMAFCMNGSQLAIRVDSCDTQEKIQAFMAGRKLYYPLKDPVITPIDPPLNLTYKVADFGTEQLVPVADSTVPSTPFIGTVRYSTDLTRELVHIVDENVRERVDDLDATIVQKADKDGVYSQMTVGNAYNLMDRHAEGTDRQIGYDTSCGKASISDDGSAGIQELRGSTIQLQNLVADEYQNVFQTGDGYVELPYAYGGEVQPVLYGRTYVPNQQVPDDGERQDISLWDDHYYYTNIDGVEDIVTGLSVITVTPGTDKVTDLTQMFFPDHEPSTIEEMRRLYPSAGTGAYNPGEVVGVKHSVWTTPVFNQLNIDGNFTSTANWLMNQAYNPYWTMSCSDNVFTLTCAADGGTNAVNMYRRDVDSVPAGHKFLVHVEINPSIGISVKIFTSYAKYIATGIPAGQYSIIDAVVATTVGTNKALTFERTGSFVQNDTISIRNFQVVDLTLMFGAGHEPTTKEEALEKLEQLGKDMTEYHAYDPTGTPVGGTIDMSDSDVELHGWSWYSPTSTSQTQFEVTCFDIFDIANRLVQKCTRKYTFTGNETTWTKVTDAAYPNGYYYRFDTNAIGQIQDYSNVYPPFLCLDNPAFHVSKKGAVNQREHSISITGSRYIIVCSSASLEDIKEELAGTTIVYKATSVQETIVDAMPVVTTPANGTTLRQTAGTIPECTIRPWYDATEYDMRLHINARYWVRKNGGPDQFITGQTLTLLHVVCGQDQVAWTDTMGITSNSLDSLYALYPYLKNMSRLPYGFHTLSYNGIGIKTVGFNLLNITAEQGDLIGWDTTNVPRRFEEGKFYVGFKADNTINTAYAQFVSTSASQVNFKSRSYYGLLYPMRCFPNTEYQFTGTRSATNNIKNRMVFYDIDGAWISAIEYNANANDSALFTTPENAYWMCLLLATSDGNLNSTRYETNPCVHLTWSGYRNGDYETYWEETRSLPITDRFPDGMNGYGTNYDTLKPSGTVKRFNTYIFTGTESISRYAWSYAGFSFAVPQMLSGDTSCFVDGCIKGIGLNYLYANSFIPEIGVTGTSLVFHVPGVRTVAKMKEWLRGRKLVYRLATPDPIPYDEPLNLTYKVADFGTEQMVPGNPTDAFPTSTALSAVIRYNSDMARTITKLREDYISKESLADLNAQLGPALNGTISGEYNPTTGKFEFSFTRNPTVAALAADASAPSLNIGMTYTQSPTVNVTYTLPTPSDLTQDNVITIDFTSTGKTVTFKHGTTTLTPQRDADITTGKKVRYLCTYSFGTWCIFPLEVK